MLLGLEAAYCGDNLAMFDEEVKGKKAWREQISVLAGGVGNQGKEVVASSDEGLGGSLGFVKIDDEELGVWG